MAENFGRLLQRYRVMAGLSQEHLAERAGVSTNAISALERGLRHAPHSATLDLLVSALRLDERARREIEECAKRARARRTHEQQHKHDSDASAKVVPNNLPTELTSFVDRKKEVAEIKELLQSYRLVTLVGTGGAGKTRCAMKIGGDLHGGFADGVWVADLTAIADPDLVSTVIARAMNVPEVPNRPTKETVLAHLKRKQALMILDNCEHVIHEARRVVAAILRDCADIRVLVTSRESLSIAGEQTYRMPSLPVPSSSELLSPNEMSQYGAIQLFNDRALAADNRFTLTTGSAPHVADICRRLDGIPLAIELAAARVTSLSPKQLAQKLDERFRVLTAGDRSALPRHRTMRALIDWSYDLLSDDESKLFRKLAIFAGGFTLEMAAAVCGEREIDEITVVDLLSSLVDKSLVQVDIVGGDTRYRLLESMRQYAREKLHDSGEEEVVAHAHARAFLELAERLFDAWEMTPDGPWNVRVRPELENFRAALSWTFGSNGDVLLGQRLAAVLRVVWYFFGPAEGWCWVQAAQQRATARTPGAIVAMLDLAESGFAYLLGRYKTSAAAAERALARYRELANPRGVAFSERQLGMSLVFLGKIAEGEALVEGALEAFQAMGYRRSVIVTLNFSGSARILAGDLIGARQRLTEALAAARAFGAERHAGYNALLSLAEVEFRDGNAPAALQLVNEALAVVRASGDALGVARAQQNMTAYLVALRRFDEARAAARDAVTPACDARISTALVSTLQHLAAIAALRPAAGTPVIEDRRRAARILGYVDAQLVALETSREYVDRQECNAMTHALRDALGDDELGRLMALGSKWSEEQAIAEAMQI